MLGSPLEHHPSNIFHGVRFVLLGFDPLNKANVLKKLIDGGAVDAGQFGPNCTHVIVHRLVYDDPLCIAARRNGKTLVTSLWVDHSFDAGMPADLSSIMYRPLRELNGIPGAKFLVICLTGYQRQDREDIMTMVGLMGATFSKPLVAHKVTHLVCYKFEGEKYELAKKMKRIKLVNHQWLEDCLRAWEILSETNYDKSGYELVMEAEAKDSEEEGEGAVKKQHAGRVTSIQQPFMLKEETYGEPLDCFAPKGFGNIKGTSAVTEKNTSAQVPNLFETQNKRSEMLGFRDAGKPSSPFKATAIYATGENELTSTSKDARTPNSDASKLGTKSYSRKTPRRTTPPIPSGEGAGNLNSSIKRGKLNLDKAYEFSSSSVPHENVKIDAVVFKTPDKGSPLGSEEKQTGTLSEKRKTEVLSGSSKLQKIGTNAKKHIPEHSVMASRTGGVGLDCWGNEPVDTSTRASPCKSNQTAALDLVRKSSSISATKSSRSTWKSVKRSSPISKTVASEIMQEENLEGVQTYSKGLKRATLNSKGREDVDMSTPQPTTVEEQKQQNEAQDIAIRTPCTEKLNITKSNTNTKSGGVGVSRPEHVADEDHEFHNVMQHILIPSSNNKRSGIEKSPSSGNLEPQIGGVLQSDSKPLGRNKVDKKLLGPKGSLGKGKTTNQKGSIFLKKTDPLNDSLTCSTAVEEMEHLHKVEMAGAATISEIEMVMKKADGHSDNLAEINSACGDDETEPPEDKEAPAGEKCGKVEGEIIEGMIVDDEEQLTGGTGQTSAARGRKSQLKKSNLTDNQVMEKITKGKKCCLSKSKKTSVPSILRASTEKMVSVDGEIESPKPKEKEVGEEKCEEAEPNNTIGSEAKDEAKKSQLGKSIVTEKSAQKKITKGKKSSLSKSKSKEGSEAKDEGKKSQLGKSIVTEKSAQKKITKGKKSSLSKSKSKAVPSVLCVTTEQEASKDESANEDKNEKKETKKDTTPRSVGKSKRTLARNTSKNTREVEKENQPIHIGDENKDQSKNQKGKTACEISKKSNPKAGESVLDLSPKERVPQTEPVWFILSGHRLQRKEFRQVLKRLKGRVCRDSHQWSYQATHFIVPDPIRRTEKFFAAAASGRWILRTEFLTDSNQSGKFLSEEPYEWHKNGLSEDSAINLEAPRKWRLLKEKTGHGAFYGMRIIIYGECIAPPLDTLKRVIMAGDGTILATSPPYTRFLGSGIDFAIVSPGMPHVDVWVQEFLRHEIPCVVADYLVEFVCKPGYSLERHVQYNTHAWAEKSCNNLKNRLEEIIEPSTPPCDDDVACQVCGSRDRGDVMLICGDESGSTGCGVGTHIDCCDPPLDGVPEEDWYCPKCSKTSSSKTPQKKTKKKSSTSKRK